MQQIAVWGKMVLLIVSLKKSPDLRSWLKRPCWVPIHKVPDRSISESVYVGGEPHQFRLIRDHTGYLACEPVYPVQTGKGPYPHIVS